VFVSDKPFKTSLMFASKAAAYLSIIPLRHSTLDRLLASPTSCRRPAMDKHPSLLVVKIMKRLLSLTLQPNKPHRVPASGKLVQANLIIVGKAGAYMSKS
jgi:hypothetical protein